MDTNIIKKKVKKADAILTSDWHIRESKPKCRTDNYLETQDKKITFIFQLAQKNRCPILISGDLGHEPNWSCHLLRWFIYKIKKYNVDIYAIIGQHDTHYHNLKNWRKSAIGVLGTAGVINLIGTKYHFPPNEIKKFHLIPFPYGRPMKKIDNSGYSVSKPMVAMTHQMVINKKLWPGQVAIKGHQLLRKYPQYQLILSGDNHSPFVSEYEGRILVNPGSVFRQNADEIDHKPRIYLWYSTNNTVKPIYIPIEEGVVSRDHIEEKTERDERFDNYIQKMKLGYKVGTSYKKNLNKYFRKNVVEKNVIERILEVSE